MNSRLILLLTCVMFLSVALHAQYRSPSASGPSELKDKIFFGGGGGFSGGTEYINVSLSPLVGYKITDQFAAGVQLTYQYVKLYDNKLSNYGGGPFMQYSFTENFYAYTQYEYLNFGFFPAGARDPLRSDFNSWFVGLGYSEPLGGNISFNVTALYNVLYKDGTNSPYQSPLQFRIGVVAGF